jgi:hypothetical protein
MPKSQTSRKKKPQENKPGAAKVTIRSTAGPGFDFEDQSAAWLMVRMLRGIMMPGIEAYGVGLQMQTRALGWDIDDILVQCKGSDSVPKQLAISCKSNVQVTSSGLPFDFVIAAWALWLKIELFQRGHDCLILLTRGSDKKFLPVWSDLKTFCTDEDILSAIAKINASNTHKKIYDSVKAHISTVNVTVTDGDVVNLIHTCYC